ncbi:TIGR02444 family protein, partial [Klebsiella pneumoniae]|nr:TIGR02444 family protein [Klebsiella pneumoniae]
MSTARIEALRDIAEPWQREVVGPLRALRQQWRTAAHEDATLASLRDQVKALELEAEKTLLARLQACSQQWPRGP